MWALRKKGKEKNTYINYSMANIVSWHVYYKFLKFQKSFISAHLAMLLYSWNDYEE